MSEFEFYVDVEDSTSKLGGGPLTSVTDWTYTARLDRAGTFSCTFAATDPTAKFVELKRILRAYALIDSVWTEVGAGIVDELERTMSDDGNVMIRVSGEDLIRELSYRTVGNLSLRGTGSGTTHSGALTSITTFAPAGWTFTPDATPPNNYIYGRFNGDSVLSALLMLAEKTQTHFYRGTGRSLIFADTWSSSGVRAVNAVGTLGLNQAAISGLSLRKTSSDLLTRIYPRGSGNGDVQLTLAATTRTSVDSYFLDKTNNYIEDLNAVTKYGRIESWLDYREIGPVDNTLADIQSAANMLFDAALEELKRRVEATEAVYYDIQLGQCPKLLRPMQSIVIEYVDNDIALDARGTLNILESTWSITPEGYQTTGLVVSSVDRWPESDTDAIVGSMMQGQLYQALPQINANSYVMTYTKILDRTTASESNNAVLRFRFGPEVIALQKVTLELQIQPLESTVRAVSSQVVTSSAGSAHTHVIPNHQHNLDIIGNGTGALTYQIGFGSGGTSGGVRHNINTTDYTWPTTSTSGGTTSESEGAHTHTVIPNIQLSYGVFRETTTNTYVVSDLEYSVNGDSYTAIGGAAVGGWYSLDITSRLVNDLTIGKPTNDYNTVEIRPKISSLNKTAQIEAQISVRNTIQAITYS